MIVFTAIGYVLSAAFVALVIVQLLLLIPYGFNHLPLSIKRAIVTRTEPDKRYSTIDRTYWSFRPFNGFYFLGTYRLDHGVFTEQQRGFGPHFIWQR